MVCIHIEGRHIAQAQARQDLGFRDYQLDVRFDTASPVGRLIIWAVMFPKKENNKDCYPTSSNDGKEIIPISLDHHVALDILS